MEVRHGNTVVRSDDPEASEAHARKIAEVMSEYQLEGTDVHEATEVIVEGVKYISKTELQQ